MNQKLNWKLENLSSLSSSLLKNVRKNMRTKEYQPTVRFGTTGTGEFPNYQIKFINDTVITYQSRSHKKYTGTDVFDDNNLSRPFTYAEIDEVIAKI